MLHGGDASKGGMTTWTKPSVHDWTKQEPLRQQLAQQAEVDPDDIFGQAIHQTMASDGQAIDLFDIFGNSNPNHRYHRRGSSAQWNRPDPSGRVDLLTSTEEENFRSMMGFCDPEDEEEEHGEE